MQDLGTAREYISEQVWGVTWERALPFIKSRTGLHFYPDEFLDSITVKISDRIKTALGYAHWRRPGQHKILLHPVLLDPWETTNAGGACETDYMKEVFFHELAHLTTRRVWGPQVNTHGTEWGMVMAWFNYRPVRCHDIPTDRLRIYLASLAEKESEEALKELLL